MTVRTHTPGARAQRLLAGAQALQRLADEGEIGLSSVGQAEAVRLTPEQAHAQMRLQLRDLVADRALGLAQLVRRPGEAARMGRRRERPQGADRRQDATHAIKTAHAVMNDSGLRGRAYRQMQGWSQ